MVDPLSIYRSGAPIISVDGSGFIYAFKNDMHYQHIKMKMQRNKKDVQPQIEPDEYHSKQV